MQTAVVALDASERLIVSSDQNNGNITVWVRNPPVELVAHQDTVSSLHLLDDTVVSGSRDLTVRVWDLATGVAVCRFDCRQKVSQVRANGSSVLSGGSQGELKLLDTR